MLPPERRKAQRPVLRFYRCLGNGWTSSSLGNSDSLARAAGQDSPAEDLGSCDPGSPVFNQTQTLTMLGRTQDRPHSS